MSTHVVAWFESIDSATLAAINNMVDDVLSRPTTERYAVPSDYRWLRWAAALGPNITRAQIVTPSLGTKRESYEIIPRAEGVSAFDLLNPEVHRLPRPVPLVYSEELEAQVAEDAAGAANNWVLACLGPEQLPEMPAGEIRIIRSTGTATLTANAWSTVTLTPDLTLEPGEYTLVGFIANSATAIAARAILVGQQYRPGMPAVAGAEDVAMDYGRKELDDFMWYNMGKFMHRDFPQIQFLASAADTAERVFLFVIRTGAAPAA